jgi:hypothetical protein
MKLTVKQFQELYYISERWENDIDKSIKLVGVITGKTPEEVEAMKVGPFNRICAKIQKQFSLLERDWMRSKPRKLVRIGKRFYRLHYDITRFPNNAGKYIDAMSFSKDLVPNIHIIMATMAEPVNWRGKPYKLEHSQIAADMEKLDFEVAYHAAVFFYLLFQASMSVTRPYLVKQITRQGIKKETAELLLNYSSRLLDGLPMPRWSLNMKQYLSNRFGV